MLKLINYLINLLGGKPLFKANVKNNTKKSTGKKSTRKKYTFKFTLINIKL